jgi:probable blue pigment (indigoidine) exporter
MPVNALSFLALLSPVVATLLGWAVLGQTLNPVQLAGATLVIAAVVGAQAKAASVHPVTQPVDLSPAARSSHLCLRSPIG